MPPAATSDKPVFRFAPSPNGELHIGHAYSALVTHHLARAQEGRFLLRLEDVDMSRARPEFERQIYDDLDWLGIGWEKPVRKQSQHMREYADALKKLRELSVVYPCFASRRQIMQHPAIHKMPLNPDGAPLYPGIYRDLDKQEANERMEAGEAYAIRLNVGRAVAISRYFQPDITFRSWNPRLDTVESVRMDPRIWGDVVIARKDLGSSYTLSVVVDDAAQNISHVTRGMDLYHATSLQRLLQILLQLPEPVYYHHKLVLNKDGLKLSKSRNAKSLRKLRDEGLTRQLLALQLPPLPLD